MKTPDELATELMQELADSPRDWDFRQMIVDGIERDRAQREVTAEQYDLIIETIDRAKNDEESLDSEEYVSIVLDALKIPVESMAPITPANRGSLRSQIYIVQDEAGGVIDVFRENEDTKRRITVDRTLDTENYSITEETVWEPGESAQTIQNEKEDGR